MHGVPTWQVIIQGIGVLVVGVSATLSWRLYASTQSMMWLLLTIAQVVGVGWGLLLLYDFTREEDCES